MSLTANGYVIRSATDIQDSLVNRIREQVPDFLLQPADVQSNILNTSIAGLMEFENIMAELFNSFSNNTNNVMLFRQFAESLGLRQMQQYNAQVTLEFSGKYGTFIPSGTKAKNEAGDVFTTQEAVLIPTTQKVQVLALGETENVAQAGEINELITQLSSDVVVTNPSASLAYIPQETETQLKERVQARLRSPRKGGMDYALSMLQSVQGVDRRLIKFRVLEVESEQRYSRGIEAIVGGGENEAVAKALYLSFLETQKLISSPSDDDTSRSVSLDLDVFNNIIPIKFTRPKLLQLEIQLKITFNGVLTTPTALEGLLTAEVTNYINNLYVGTPLNAISLNSVIMPLVTSSGIKEYDVKTLGYSLKIDGQGVEFDTSTGYLNEIAHDCYLQLSGFSVTINE